MLSRSGVVTTLAALALAGCASMTKQECLTADWRTVGFHDAAAGRTADILSDHREACAEYGKTPDLDRYMAGREAGLLEYCRASRGYQEGLAGHTYRGVCPSSLEEEFQTGYEAGRRIYAIETQIRNQESALRDRERQVRSMRKKISEAQSLIVSSPDPSARARALLKLQSQNDGLSRLEREIDSLYREIEDLREDAARARAETRGSF